MSVYISITEQSNANLVPIQVEPLVESHKVVWELELWKCSSTFFKKNRRPSSDHLDYWTEHQVLGICPSSIRGNVPSFLAGR
jgi:hypothetical protein